MASKTLYFDIIGRDKSGTAAIEKVGKQLLGFGVVTGTVVGLAVKKWADFDAQMSQVQTLSHATSGEMSKLSDAALTMGQNIGFTATQTADAEIELTKAGIGVKDQLGGALLGTLNLAAAGQMDVADATNIAASAMTQFKLSGKDVPHIADLLAAGADKALGSVDDLGQGLSFVGPVAESMGISLEQTVGTLSLFAQNGILGEKAGTGLRGVLLSLTSPSAQAKQVMDKYNISLYDTHGNFVGVDGAAQQLHDHLGGLDQATRAAAMGQIFGNQQITAATILMDGGAKSVDKWTNAVNDQGFAAQQARGKMNNLEGDVKKLSAALDTDLIKSGSGANAELRALTQGATGLVKAVGSIPQPVLDTALAAGVALGATALLGGGFITIVPKIEATRVAVRKLNAEMPALSRGASLAGSAMRTVPFIAVAAEGAQYASKMVDSARETMGLAQSVDTLKSKMSKGLNTKSIDDELNSTVFGIKTGVDQLGQLTNTGWMSGLIKNAADFTNTFSSWNPVFRTLGGGSADLTKRVGDLDKAMAQMVQSGNAKQAAEAYDYLKTKTDGSEEALAKLKDLFPQYAAAIKGSKTATDDATTSTDANKAALAELSGQATASKGSISDLANAIRDFGKGQLDARSAERDFQAAIDAVTQSVKDNGKSLDIGTDKGRQNQAALDAIASSSLNAAGAILTQTGSQEDATKAVEQGRSALIKALAQFGITGKAAQAYANKLGLIPGNVKTSVGLTGVKPSESLVDQWKDKIKEIPGSYLTTVGIAINAPGLPAAYRVPKRAGGGDLDMAPGPKGVDSMIFKGAKGEHILTAADVDAMGGQQAVYNFRKRLHQGATPKVALAGLVPPAYASPMGAIPGGASGGPSGATNVNVRVVQKVGGVRLEDLVEMQMETRDGWQTLELSSGLGR